MKFEEAIRAMRDGKKVKTPDNKKPIMISNISIIHYEESIHNTPHFMTQDMLREDWEIVE
jgi:hypothetical protein